LIDQDPAFGRIVQLHRSARERLYELDARLGELEELNLRGMRYLPIRVGTALIDVGISDPYSSSISALIDRVFELEEPLLRKVHRDRLVR
jgi:hypothetical protein